MIYSIIVGLSFKIGSKSREKFFIFLFSVLKQKSGNLRIWKTAFCERLLLTCYWFYEFFPRFSILSIVSLHKLFENKGFHWPVFSRIRTKSLILSLYRRIQVIDSPCSRIFYTVYVKFVQYNRFHCWFLVWIMTDQCCNPLKNMSFWEVNCVIQ